MRAWNVKCAASLVLSIGLAGCGDRTSDPRGVDREETLLVVGATGRAEATPDQSIFTAGLSSTAETAQAASARNAETMARITASLAALGIDRKDIQTQNLSLNRVTYGPNRGRYEAANVVSVRVRKIDAVAQALAGVTAAGANIISGPNLSLADPERAALGAHVAAYRAARAKAEAYADAASMKVVRVLAIQDGGQAARMAPMLEAEERDAMAMLVATQTAAPPVLAGTNMATVSVRVSFALAPK